MKNIFCVLVLLLNCASLVAQKGAYETKSNIPYYLTPFSGNDVYKKEQCLLDLYYPRGEKDFATIIWFHGGGLTGGEKEIPGYLKNKGIGVVGVGYRFSPHVKSPAFIEDAAAAVAWVFNNIKSFGGDKKRIFLSGHSAGGYLALMLGLDKRYLSKYQIDADELAGLIPFSPQCITHFTVRKEQGIDEKQPLVDALAPLYHVRNSPVPLVLLTGDRELEILGRYEENAYLARMMKLQGHKNIRLYELDGYDHGMVEPGLPLLLKELNRILKEKMEK